MAIESVFVECYADVDVRYGGVWIKDCGDYAEWVEVTDLDSATGTTGMVLVESGSVSFYSRDLHEIRSMLDRALSCCGDRKLLLETSDRKWKRLMAWEALHGYKRGDIDQSVIVLTDREAPAHQDGWHADMVIEDECELRQWLFQAFNVPAHERCTEQHGELQCSDCGADLRPTSYWYDNHSNECVVKA